MIEREVYVIERGLDGGIRRGLDGGTVKALYYGPLYYGQPPIMDTQKIPDL